MTDISNVPSGFTIDAELGKKQIYFHVDETYWGYIIRKGSSGATPMMVLQGMSMFLGASFAAAALGLILVPDALMGSIDMVMRGGAAVLFGAIAAYLLWFASRGTQSELQIDNSLGEVREVVRNRAGRSTLIGRYGFDAIGGVFLDRAASKTGDPVLMLRYRNTAQTLPVATAPEEELEKLRNRLGRDLMIDRQAPERADRMKAPSKLRAAA